MSAITLYSLMAVANQTFNYEAEVIAKIVNEFGAGRQMSILYENATSSWLGQILDHIDMPVILNAIQRPEKDLRLVGHPNALVVVLDESLSASDVINSTLREHRTVYMFTTHSLGAIETKLLQYWKCLVVSAFALFLNGTKGRIFGYEPTPDGIYVTEREKIEHVDVFNGHGLLVNTSVANLPPSVLLQERETDIDGYEGRLVLEVTKKFNLTTRFASARDGELWGWVHPSPAGAVGEVLTEYSGFAVGDIAATYSRTQAIDQLPGYSFMECLTWIVPKGAGAAPPTWVSILITEYGPDAWLGITVSAISIIIACVVVDDSRITHILFRVFAISIGSPIEIPMKASSRILMTVWVWASFVIAVAYQASMGSKLAVPPEKPDIETFIELSESNLNLTGLFNSFRLLNLDDPILGPLRRRHKHNPDDLESVLNRISTKRDTAYFRQIRTFRYNAVLDPHSLDSIHIMTADCPFSYFSSIAMTRWSPFYRGTKKIVQRVMESGLSAKWENDLMPEIPVPAEPPSPLDLDHLLGAFAVLIIGFIISLLTYLVEKTWHLNWERLVTIGGRKKHRKLRWMA